MVVGDRLSSTYFQENKRPFHNFGNSLVRFCINHIFQSNIKDIMTGYRAFSYRFVKTFPVLSRGFEIETEMTIHAISMNMALDNVIIEYRDRPEGSESKLNTVSDGLKVLRTILNLFKNYRPFEFFSVIAFGSVSDFSRFVYPVCLDSILPYRTGRPIPDTDRMRLHHTGCPSLLLGMILDSIKQKERREFEFRLSLLSLLRRQDN